MSDLDLIYGTKPKTVSPSEEKPKEEQKTPRPSKETPKKAIKKESKYASTLASTHTSIVETIRKTVKSLGTKVSFTRVTPEEKARLADIIYTYKRQGVKTSENEINRIAMNFLIEDFHNNGKESVLAQVIEALNA
jgi:predicted DsbA family dithiol-disulfide isomerase